MSLPPAFTAPADRLATLPEGVPDLTLGWEALKWTSKYLRQPNGPKAGQRFEPTMGQLRFLLWWYAVQPDGQWVFHHGVRRLAKGSGKSPFAAVLALLELCGPVRLKDFDPTAPGGVVGKPVAMPLVQIAATAESQTANTMRMVRAFAPKGSRVCADHNLEFGRTRYNKMPEGGLEVITASSSAAEGAEATYIVADETEWWLPTNGGPELFSTLLDNLTKSGSRMLETANAWKPGKDSVAESSFNSWVAQEEGKVRIDSRVLYDARIAAPDTDMADDDSLREALEHIYGDCWWVDIRPIMTRMRDTKSFPDDSKRKYLNWPTAPEGAWVTPQEWGRLADAKRVVTDGERVVLFFDGSKSRDATALMGCCLSDGHVFTCGVWEPGNQHDSTSTVVNVPEIDAVVEQTFDRLDVVAFYADVKEWEGFTKVTWPERYRDALQVWAVPGGKDPQPIAWDMRSHGRDFTLAAELVEAEIREGAFTHDGHGVVARHVANARRAESKYGITVKKETPDSPDKIDACVCVIGARMAYRLALAAAPAADEPNEAFFLNRWG